MNKLVIFFSFFFTVNIYSQEINTQRISDWSDLKKSGFYESVGGNNIPNAAPWHWGINIAHSYNAGISGKYSYGAQIIFPVQSKLDIPSMHIRSTDENGYGIWAKVLIDKGDQTLAGNLSIAESIKIKNNVEMEIGSMLGRRLDDTFIYDNKTMGHYGLLWTFDSSTGSGPILWQSGYGGIKFFTDGKQRLMIQNQGNIGIGTENPQNKLDVAGTIRATEVKVEALPWADFVFDKEYKLPSLKDVESHIEEHKHLPGIPSESEVKENGGVGLGEMQVKLLQKIEELTLYVIDLKKENQIQNQRIQELEKTNK